METQDRKAGRAIELFHFAFLAVALTQVKPSDFALKGGGNLRLFLRSKRRSRDVDLDFLGSDFGRFGDRVDAVLRSPALASVLRTRDIRVVEPRRTKDTDTVKRWKLALAVPAMEDAPTKVELSGRVTTATPVVERSDEGLARRLGVRAVVLNHYPPVDAIEQKVGALAARSETQPRDVFDLDHLFREYPEDLRRSDLRPATIRAAVARARELTYEGYRDLVVQYLEAEVIPLYESRQAWESMQLAVVAQLERRLADTEGRG